MAKYQVMMLYPDGANEMMDEVFDSYDEAYEYGCECCSDYVVGGEILEMSNPGDYPLDPNVDDVDFEVVEVDT